MGAGVENWPISSLHQGALLHAELNSAASLPETRAKTTLMYLSSTYKGLELYACDLNP